MHLSYTPTESDKDRHQRLFNNRINKAKVLSQRVETFLKDLDASTFYKDSEKRKIKEQLKFLKTSI